MEKEKLKELARNNISCAVDLLNAITKRGQELDSIERTEGLTAAIALTLVGIGQHLDGIAIQLEKGEKRQTGEAETTCLNAE